MAFVILYGYSIFKALLAIIVVWLIYRVFCRIVRRFSFRLPPGPKGLPLLGYVSFVEHLFFLDHREKYGEISHVNILGNDVVVLNSMAAIREALTAEEMAGNFDYRPPSHMQSLLVNFDIILQPPSAEWRDLKRIVTTLMKQNGEGIVELEEVFGRELEHLTGILETNIGRKLNINDSLKAFSVNVMCMFLIGERYDYDHDVIRNVSRCIEVSVKLSEPLVDMTLQTLPIIRRLPFALGNHIREFLRLRAKILDHFFNAKKQLPDDELRSKKGIVFDLIRHQQKEHWLTDDKIEGAVQNLIAGAVYPIKSSLSAFFLIILTYPEVQTRIQSEIDRIIGKERSQRRPKLSDQQHMPYIRAVVLELLRYTSIVPMPIPHTCVNTVELFGFTIPAGSVVLPNIFSVHHDEKYWSSPWEFNPSRFLDDSGELLPASHPNRRNCIPFGVGNRVCVGENFAKTRIFLAIVYLLQKFTFSSADDVPPSCDPRGYICGLVIHSEPFRMIFKHRV